MKLELPPVKFSPQEEAELIFLIASFRSDYELRKWARKRGLTLTTPIIRNYKDTPAFAAQIERHRQEWGNKIFDFAFSHKRARINQFIHLYQRLKSDKQYKAAADQLINIRHEVEGEKDGKPNIYNLQYNQFMNMSDEELESQRLRCMNELKRLKQKFPNAVSRLEEN